MLSDAKWISPPVASDEHCFVFFRKFRTEKHIQKAFLTVTAMGMYMAYINGERADKGMFNPGFTAYDKRVQYQKINVTDLIRDENEISITAAEGWASGYLRLGENFRNHYADNIAVLFSLDITYADGKEETVVSDENTEVKTSHIITSSLYHGETVDMTAKTECIGNAKVNGTVKTVPVPMQGEYVSEHERIAASELIITPKGERVIDFGQNFSGYVQITAKGRRGDIIKISHAETLDSEGCFYTENLRTAKQQNVYVLSGSGTEVFKPSFSCQGFRYIRIDEFTPENFSPEDFVGVAVYSDIRRTGSFVCGNDKVNRLYENVLWGQKSNFTDIPTDCPQRDERLGWSGDAQVFARTAAINFDVEKFFEKWLADLALEQRADGAVPSIIPTGGAKTRISAAWGDAAVICPWQIYLAYGNTEILENQFDSMQKWIDYMHGFGDSEFLFLGGDGYGDWLGLDAADGSLKGATSYDLIASAFFAYSTSLFIKAGKIIGKDMSTYERLHENTVNAFRSEFMNTDVPGYNTQTAYALELCFGLADDREKTVQSLVNLIKKNDGRLATGFVGTPYLLHALSANGCADAAYDLLLSEKYPSWLYSVNRGATTIWEHWDGIKDDGSFWDSDMNSFNHYAYGSVFDWIFTVSAGISPTDGGYKRILIKPIADRRLGFLNAGIETRCGRVAVSWHYDKDRIRFEITVPENASADIELPDGTRKTVGAGVYLMSCKERKND